MSRAHCVTWVVLLTAAGCVRPGAGGEPFARTPHPDTRAAEPSAPDDLVSGVPDPATPVLAGAAVRPARVRPGEEVTLFVQARIAPGWHIAGPPGTEGAVVPTALRLSAPAGLAAAGPWVYPPTDGGTSGYEAGAVFRLRLRVDPDARPGPFEVTCEFHYQACDQFRCRLPATLVVRAGVEVTADP